MGLRHIARFHRNNVQTLRHSPLAEISGALGDLGTLLPLMLALALQGSISLSSTLVLSGAFNVLTGIVFGLPQPVQPMKAIAAAAIAHGSDLRTTVAAGALVSAATLLLATTGLLRRLAAAVPVPVVKGIQLGAGLSLVLSAGSGLLAPLHWARPAHDNRLWALAAFALLLATQRRRRFPFALLAFLAGLAAAFAALLLAPDNGAHTPLPRLRLWQPHLALPAWTRADALGMAVAQLPLTLLNSVVASAALAAELFPALPAPSVTALGASVGFMNLAGCWVGAMPVCHGSGGLAAQHRFGARSGASVVVLGLAKVVLGLLCGETLLGVLGRFPRGVLGVMVVAAGMELAMVGENLNNGSADLWETAVRDPPEEDGEGGGFLRCLGDRFKRQRILSEEERRERWAVMLITTAGLLAFRNDAVGFAAGMLCHWSYRLSDWIETRKARRHDAASETDPLLH